MEPPKRLHRRGGFWVPPVQAAVCLLRARKDAICRGIFPPLRPGDPVPQAPIPRLVHPHRDMGIKDSWYPPTPPGCTILEPIADSE